jgi:WD40 repeat protein
MEFLLAVQIWDAETGKCVKTFKGHTNWVHSVEWEVGGKRVLSQSDDGTSRIWNVETGDCDEVIENIGIPPNFIVGSASSISTDLSRKSDDGNPVGIQCDKVKICGERACGWIGKTVVFFKLQKSDDFEQSMHEIEPEDLSIFMAKKEIVFRRGSLSLKRMPTSSNSMGSHPLNFATTCA